MFVKRFSGSWSAGGWLPAWSVLLVAPLCLYAACAGSDGNQTTVGDAEASGGNRGTSGSSGGAGSGTGGKSAAFPRTAKRITDGLGAINMAIAGDRLILTNEGGVYSMPKSGAVAPTRLADGPALGLVVAGNRIYWARVVNPSGTANSVLAMDLDGSNQVALHTLSPMACGFTYVGGLVYWSEPASRTIFVHDPSGGTPRVLLSNTGDWVCGLTGDNDGSLYWTDNVGLTLNPTGEVITLAANAKIPVVLATNQDRVSVILRNGNHVYWLNTGIGSNDGSINRLPITTPPAPGTPMVLARELDDPNEIAIDGDFLYWTEFGVVRRVRLTGGASTSVSELPDVDIVSITIDDTDIYFSSYSNDVVNDNAIYRVAK